MSELETFILGVVMVCTMDPNIDEDPEIEFETWARFWDQAMPTWNRAARDHEWRFASMHIWNPEAGL